MKGATPLLQLDRIRKCFFGVEVLHDVSLHLGEGEVLGLVGENGAGKSTLMNILGGVLRPDDGEMRLSGAVHAPRDPAQALAAGIAFIHQELSLFPNLTVAENLFISALPGRRFAGLSLLDRRGLHRRAEESLARVELGVAPDTPLEQLSPGERQLVEVARALGGNARIVIFDEPTTSLTRRECERLFALIGRLRARGIAIVYISHNLADVLRLSDRILILRDGRNAGEGPAAGFSREEIISRMVGRKLEKQYPQRTGRPLARKALEVRGLTSPGLLDGVSFDVHCGEILGVAGLLGAGRTELARALFGLDSRRTGEVRFAGVPQRGADPRDCIRQSVAYVTEDRRSEGLLMDASVETNLALVSLPFFSSRVTGLVDEASLEAATRKAAESTGIAAALLGMPAARMLSGGNQQKVVLAKWLVRSPRVLCLDEPTRGIDVGARYDIHCVVNRLAAGGAGILLISSEIEELTGMCDRILAMRAGRISACFERGEFDPERILTAMLGES